MESESLKLAHELFVTGHDGSSALDILITVFPVIPGTFSSILLTDGQRNLYNFAVQYVLCILPMVLSFTVLSSATILLNVFMFTVAALSWAYSIKAVKKHKKFENKIKSSHLPYLTSGRSTILICTIISILAVDFRCFPRRFAKTEFYGYSLMDIGVSCFVFMHGAFDRIRTRKSGQFLTIFVLLILGFLRLLSVRATNYQHHVTEYGVHANFFFTLAVLKLLCTWWAQTVTVIVGLTSSVLICALHHIILAAGVAEWTLSDSSRDTIVSANREFIVSIPGYVVIYVLGSVTATFVYSRLNEAKWKQNLTLLGATSLGVIVLSLFELCGIAPSRRLANPPFVVWTTIFVLFYLTVFKSMELVVERISGKRFSPVVFECVNSNPLLFFLAANLLTGLINFSIDTMKVSFPVDFIIINSYIVSLLLTVYILFIKINKSNGKT